MKKFLIKKPWEESWRCIKAFSCSSAIQFYINTQPQLWLNNNVGQIIVQHEADKDGWAIEEAYYIIHWLPNLINIKTVNVNAHQLDWKNGF